MARFDYDGLLERHREHADAEPVSAAGVPA
jgi:hypothetical protein